MICMLVTLLFASAPLSPLTEAINFRSQIETSRSEITLGDVANLDSVPAELRSRAAGISLFRLPHKRRKVEIDHAYLVSRSQSLMPMLSVWLPKSPKGTLSINRIVAEAKFASASCETGLAKGAATTVAVDAGWFRVERKVEAMQEALPGQRFFGRTEDGQIIQAYCGESE